MSTAKHILVIDVEATCWENLPPNTFPESRNEIIEIGITRIDIATKDIIDSNSILVRPPTTEINEFCTRLTTLTPEMVQSQGVSFLEAIDVLRTTYRSDRNVWASWGDYDRRSFEKNCRWNSVNYPFVNMHLNVKSLFAAQYGWNGGLEKCATSLGIPFEGTPHRGVDDSRVIARILQTFLKTPSLS